MKQKIHLWIFDGTPNVDFSLCSNLGMASMSDFGSSIIRINTLLSPEERKKATVSIYLLNLQSPMLMLIRSAWNNYLIVSTQKLYLKTMYSKVIISL